MFGQATAAVHPTCGRPMPARLIYDADKSQVERFAMSNSAPQNEQVGWPNGDMSTVPLRVSQRAHRTSCRAIVETGVGFEGVSEILTGDAFRCGWGVWGLRHHEGAGGVGHGDPSVGPKRDAGHPLVSGERCPHVSVNPH